MKIFLLFILLSSLLKATCPLPSFTPPNEVKIESDILLLVTHVSTQWDSQMSAKAGANEVVAYAKDNEIPFIYLQNFKDPHTYYYTECNPTYYVESYGGEFQFSFPSKHVLSIGGFYERCKRNTLEHAMAVWEKGKTEEDLRITEIEEGIYMAGDYVRNDDPYREAYLKFKSEKGLSVINLFDFMSVVNDSKMEKEYVKRLLSQFKMPPKHRVVVEVDGKESFVLKEKTGAPTLTFNYIRHGNTLRDIFWY